MDLGQTLVLLYAGVGLLVFLLYGWDKWQARRRARRIPEWVLLTSAALGGSAGALLGMVVWNHKTSHARFRYLVPLLWLLHIYYLFTVIL